ncbi:hypothetical protein LguiA_032618 [Lonicera macranthoides]
MREAQSDMEEEKMQQFRSRATELLLREEWKESVQAYTHFISLCQQHISNSHNHPDPNHLSKLQKSLCLAFSNRAEARFRPRDFAQALQDCEEALKIESTHFKTLVCKGKILLNLSRYSMALNCFKTALLDPQANLNSEILNGYLQKCKKLDFLSRSGAFDISNWVLDRFGGKSPELAEYIGPVEIRKSEISGRGLFATKNIDSGTLLLVTKAVATERGILPESGENAQLVMWKNFIDKVVESVTKCNRTHYLISKLSMGEKEEGLEIPDISLFRPEAEGGSFSNEKMNMVNTLSILDVNSLVEETISAKVLGKNSDYYGVGLWLLASFINHTCYPNAKRFHIGDHVLIHASRDVKAGEEITLPYFKVGGSVHARSEEKCCTWPKVNRCSYLKLSAILCQASSQNTQELLMRMTLDSILKAGGMVTYIEERWSEIQKQKNPGGRWKQYIRDPSWEALEPKCAMVRTKRKLLNIHISVDSTKESFSNERSKRAYLERNVLVIATFILPVKNTSDPKVLVIHKCHYSKHLKELNRKGIFFFSKK